MARPNDEFMAEMVALESAYLRSPDSIVQSGFSAGGDRWIAERRPLTQAIRSDGDFLDVGCANGVLARDVVGWAAESGFAITPHGVDLGKQLIDLARRRLPEFAGNFVVADAWTWEPGRRWDYVYSLLNYAPTDLWCTWLRRLAAWVEPGGRLIIGFYGSRSRNVAPAHVGAVLGKCGFDVPGTSEGGNGPVTRFAWTEIG